METETFISNDSREKLNRVQERLEDTREKMETENHIFFEATRQFTLEWILRYMRSRRTIEVIVSSEDYEISLENSKCHQGKFGKRDLKLDLDLELFKRISDIVEAHLNHNECWIHRSELPHAGVSRDYLDFKKEKVRKELTSRVRVILGRASEVFGDMSEEEYENRIWVVERGRRKYACFLRFSDEMTASLNRYLENVEELIILDNEMKEIKKMNEKVPTIRTLSTDA